MKTNRLFSILSASLMVAACQIEFVETPAAEEVSPDLTHVTFNVSAPTKTALVGDRSVEWRTSDAISVFSIDIEEGTATSEMTSSGGNQVDPFLFHPDADGAAVTISGDIETNSFEQYYAIYPADPTDFMEVKVSKGVESSRIFRHIFPDCQSGTGAESILVSKWDASSQSFTFEHQTSMFKFVVPAELDGRLSKIVITGRDSGDKLAGVVNINIATRNTNIRSGASIPASQSVYMQDDSGIAAGTYYLAVLPKEYPSGVILSTFDLNGDLYNNREYTKSIDMRGPGATSSVQYGGKILGLGTISATKANISSTVLASWRADNSTYVSSHSPNWVSGAIAVPEEVGSSAYMTWVNVSGKATTYIVSSDGNGHYAVKVFGTGDGYEYHIPVTDAAAGATIRYQAAYRGVASCPKYWVIKYSVDNGANWNLADTGMTPQTNTNDKTYNTNLNATDVPVTVNASFVLTSAIQDGTILIRHECADGTVGISSTPGSKATVRNLGPFTDKDGVQRPGPVITYEY